MSVLVRVFGVILAIACAIALVLMVLGVVNVGPMHGLHGGGWARGFGYAAGGCFAGIVMAVTGRRPGKDAPQTAQVGQQAQAVSPDDQRTQFIQTQQAQQPQQGWQGQQQPQYPQNQPNQPPYQPNQPGDGQGGWQNGQNTGGPWGQQ